MGRGDMCKKTHVSLIQVMRRDINDSNIGEMAESLLFYEEYKPVVEYLERKKELWVSEDNYLQLNEVPSEDRHNPEFTAFLKYLIQNGLDYSLDSNNHIRLAVSGRPYVIYPYSTEKRIEKWSFDGIPITYYYTEIKSFYVIVADKDDKHYKMTAKEAQEKIFISNA